MKVEMIRFDRAAVEQATQKRGYTSAELADELAYSMMGLHTALKRGTMPVIKFKKLVKLLNVDECNLRPKDEKPVQESMAFDTDVTAELKKVTVALESIVTLLNEINNALR